MTILIEDNLCKGVEGCGYCIEICPKRIFERSEKFNERGYLVAKITDYSKCIKCKMCELICPEMAISIKEDD
ncbi:MAG: 4Fe-4S dicluster domain-containing protein [Candidatus Helarchaeota archaeon]